MTKGVNRSRAALARDVALQRVSRTRRWVIAATAALTAGFAALVSAVAPGHSLASKSQPRTSAQSGTTQSGATSSSGLPAMPAPANPGDLGLQGPGQSPSPAPAQPQSVPSQPQSVPSQPPPQSSSGGGGGGPVVSGGS